ncbi:MAG TPA: hypothetical protein VK633_08940 [Verrucomicrobiae bacterium]|nr:hypothetical protein [Verrucomicrobiae bacterium]
MKNTAIEQMELGMRNQLRNGLRKARPDRMKRARWWFNRMRQVVDLALPAHPSVSPRPEQTYFQLRQERGFDQ